MTRGTQPGSLATKRKGPSRKTMKSLGSVLKVAIVSGLVAGAVAAAFHSLLSEPLIDRAIQIEERLSQDRGEAVREPVVDRPTQHWGLLIGLLLYGITWGLLFGVAYYLTRSWQPSEWTESRRAVVAALLVGWSVAVVPFLKYPANPPGVGDPETMSYRQWLYLGFVGLSVAGVVLAVALRRVLSFPGRRSGKVRAPWPLVLAIYAIYAAAVYVLMPPNPDPVRMPAQLVWTFRGTSLAGLLLFWVVLASMAGWLSRERTHGALERLRA